MPTQIHKILSKRIKWFVLGGLLLCVTLFAQTQPLSAAGETYTYAENGTKIVGTNGLLGSSPVVFTKTFSGTYNGSFDITAKGTTCAIGLEIQASGGATGTISAPAYLNSTSISYPGDTSAPPCDKNFAAGISDLNKGINIGGNTTTTTPAPTPAETANQRLVQVTVNSEVNPNQLPQITVSLTATNSVSTSTSPFANTQTQTINAAAWNNASGTVRFADKNPGNYTICIDPMSSFTFPRCQTLTKVLGQTLDVEFGARSAAFNPSGKVVAVVVQINTPQHAGTITYGPANITITNKDTNNTESYSATTNSISSGLDTGSSPAQKLPINVDIDNVNPGTYTACVSGTTLCSDTFIKEANVKKDVTIEIPEDKSTQLIAAGAKGEESCNVAGVGWIVCPAALFIGKITDGAYTIVESLLVFNIPKAFDTSSANAIYNVWSNVRNLANIAFILAFFAIIFSQATSIGIGSYGIKKMLPRLIISAILVNLSYYLCVFAIDVSNILGAGMDGVLKSALYSITSGEQPGFNWSSVIANALIGVGTVGGAVAVIAVPTAGPAILGAAIMFGIAALAAVVTALVVLVARQAILVLLIVLAPLAFVAYILPNTENLFDKWKKALTTMLVFYPLVAIVFAGSQVAAAVVRIGSESGLVDIMSLAIQAFPLFALPTLMKFSGGLLGKIAGIVNNPNKGPFDAMRKKAQETTGFRKERATEEAIKGNRNQYANRWARRSARIAAERGAVKERLNEQTNAYTNSLLKPGEDGLPMDPKFAAKMAGLNRSETKKQAVYNDAQRANNANQKTIKEGLWARQDEFYGYGNNVPGTQERIAKAEEAKTAQPDFKTAVTKATAQVGEINLNKIVKVMARGQAVVDEIESKDQKAAQLLQTQLRMNGAGYKAILQQEIGTTVRGMNGESIIVTEAAKAAAGATMLSQGREVGTVMKSVAKLKDKSLRSFLVGQIGANFSTIKGRQAGIVNEDFQQAIIDGKLASDAAYDEARIIATGKNIVQLNRQQYASQEADSVEYIQKAIQAGHVNPVLVEQLRQFSREAVLEPQVNQYVPQAANSWHMQIARLDASAQSNSGQSDKQTSSNTGGTTTSTPQATTQAPSATPAPSAPAAPQTMFGQQPQSGEAMSPRTDRALRNMFEHFSNQDIVGMGAGGVNITINNAGGVSGLSNKDINKIVDALGSAGVRTPEQEQLFETLSSESLRRQQQGTSDDHGTPGNPPTSGSI